MIRTSFLVLLLASMVVAVYIPQTLPEGVSRVRSSKDPSPVKRAPQSSSTFSSGSGGGVTTGNGSGSGNPWTIYCGCGYDVTPSNTDSAVAALQSKVGDSGTNIPANSSISEPVGDVVAFACNRDPSNPVEVSSDELAIATQEITAACGSYVAGTFNYGSLDAGYMQYSSGLDFCANAEASSKHSC